MNSIVANSDTFQLSLPSDVEFTFSREFNAPRELVFECWTKPEYVRRWWSPEGELTLCDIDLRVGGRWRHIQPGEHGEMKFNGVFQEIVPGEKIVHTMIYEQMPEDPAFVTVTMEDLNGRTRVTETTRFPSKEIRDVVLSIGMDPGARLSFDKLELLLTVLQRPVDTSNNN